MFRLFPVTTSNLLVCSKMILLIIMYLFFQNTFVLNIKNNGRPGSPIKFDFCWPAFPGSQFSKPLWNFHRSMTHQKYGFVIEFINFWKFSVLWNLPEKVSWWELWKYFYIFWAALIENYRNRMAYLALKLMSINYTV